MNEKELKRFWGYVRKTRGCWEWAGPIDAYGYGRYSIYGKRRGAHRFSWTLHNGKIPKSQYICHHCDNPKCVNPSHLFIGTQADNMRDMIRKGRAVHNGMKSEDCVQAKLNPDAVRVIRSAVKYPGYLNDLALMFNVSRACIQSARYGDTWRKVNLGLEKGRDAKKQEAK